MERANQDITASRAGKAWPPVLPDVHVTLDADEIRSRMDAASRRGRVPGVHLREGEVLFEVDGCGTPFEHHLFARGESSAGGTRISFSLARRARVPLIFLVLIAVSIWPGVHFMDQLIPGEWGWIPTWTWYLPLTVLPAPWLWLSTVRKSRAIAAADATSLIEKIRAELGAPPQSA